MVEPYAYLVGGRQILLVSMVVPIIDSGKFIGVAGVDLSTDDIWDQLRTVKPFGTGSVSLISNGGSWAAHARQDQLGQAIEEADASLAEAR